MYKSTELIMEEFKNKVKYDIFQMGSSEGITVLLLVPGCPLCRLYYLCDEGNGVYVRIYGLLENVSRDNYVNVLQECNALSCETGCLKFLVDENMEVCAVYEFPENTPNDGVGPMAYELYDRIRDGLEEFSYRLRKASKINLTNNRKEIIFDEIEEMKRLHWKRMFEDEDTENL